MLNIAIKTYSNDINWQISCVFFIKKQNDSNKTMLANLFRGGAIYSNIGEPACKFVKKIIQPCQHNNIVIIVKKECPQFEVNFYY